MPGRGVSSHSKLKPVRDDYDLIPRLVLHEELNRLPEKFRLPLVLCYMEGKTNEEAAHLLQCPVGTVKGRLWRARGQLRARLSRRGLSPLNDP